MKKFLVIIPAFQSRSYIEKTLESIGIAARKAENCKVHVHIQDAGNDQASIFSQKHLVEKFYFQPISHSQLLSCGENIKHTVSKANHPDAGMYDGLMKAFLTFRLRDFDWITWIGSDDTFSESCFERINQISKFYPMFRLILSAAGVKDEIGNVVTVGTRPCSQETIAAGLHNLQHLPPIQQEGSFIRSDLFAKVIQKRPFDGFSVAGDWNLWRLATKYEIPVIVKGEPLGYFHKRKNQLSSNTKRYVAEVFRTNSEKYMQALFGSQRIIEDKCKVVQWGNTRPVLVEWNMKDYLKQIYENKYKQSFSSSSKTWKKLQEWPESITSNFVTITDSAIIFDNYWQEPAKTEKHASDLFACLDLKQKSSIFIAFPWATFLDKLNHASPDKEDKTLSALLDALSHIKTLIYKRFADRQIISVCQHIHFKKFIHFFEEIKINHVFWTHKAINEDQIRGIRIHAFPLYPVNTVALANADQKLLDSKKYLFSFIGAKANKWYLTDTRNIIFKYYESRSDVLVTSREKWHFQSNVYDQQVIKNNFAIEDSPIKNLLNEETQQFLQALRESAFSLCPSGSGPNSIRLWESLESNIVPVVLADTYDPPGLYSLWQQSILFIEENDESIKHIATTLKNIDKTRYHKFANCMKQIVYDYGKEHFITDILRLVINIELGGLQCVYPSLDKRPGTKSCASRNSSVESSLSIRLASFVNNKGCELFPSRTQTNSTKADHQLRLGSSLSDILAFQSSYKADKNKEIVPKDIKNKIKYFLAGKHSHRTPLSYCNIQSSLIEQGIERTLNIDDANCIITGFSADLPELIKELKCRNKSIIIISEELLWDLTWSKNVNLSEINQEQMLNNTIIKYLHLNHINSDIFDFNLIPYFLLTDSKYISRYILAFQRVLKLSKREILEHWNNLPQSIAFIQEKRLDSAHEYVFDQTKPIKLSKFRTDLAINVNMDNVYVEGKGWPSKSHDSHQAVRQEIPDWHLDKLSKLNKKFRFVSALENVHHQNYVTEKIFDAYSSMAVPIYYASNDHYIWKLLKHSSFVNLYGMSAEEASNSINCFQPGLDFVDRYIKDIKYLHELFSNITNFKTETANIACKLRQNLDILL